MTRRPLLTAAGGTREWGKIVKDFIPGKMCWLRFPRCTGHAQTIDHYWPRVFRPDLVGVPSNWRPACSYCNRARRHTLPQDIPRLRAKLEAKARVTQHKPKALGFFK